MNIFKAYTFLIAGFAFFTQLSLRQFHIDMITFGVIGTSWITDSFIESAQETGKWKLTAVYSRTEEKAIEFATKYGIKKVFTAIDAMAADDAVDAIYIASPNSLHFEQTKIVLAAGKHAIVEKPITSNLREFEQLYSLARQAPKGAKLIEAYRHVQEANFKVLKQSLSKVGKCYGGNIVFAQHSSRYVAALRGETPTIFSAEYSGGCLVDLGVYPICFTVALFGKPKKQTYYPIMLHTGTDAGGPIVFEYEDFTLTLYTSKCYSSTAPTEIYGEKGTLTVNGVTDIDSIKLSTTSDKQTTQLAGAKTKYNLMEEALEFHRLIEENDTVGLKALEDLSRNVIEVTEALRRANGIVYPADKA